MYYISYLFGYLKAHNIGRLGRRIYVIALFGVSLKMQVLGTVLWTIVEDIEI